MKKPELERALLAAVKSRKIELTLDDIRRHGLIAALREKTRVDGTPTA